MGEAQQGCREDKREGEQLVDADLCVAEFIGRATYHGLDQHVDTGSDHCPQDQRGSEIGFPQSFEALEDKIGRESPGHDSDQYRHHLFGGLDHVCAVGDGSLDQVEKGGRDQSTQHRGDDPAGSDGAHLRPVGDTQAASGYAGAQYAADDGVGGGNRCPKRGGDVQPDRACQQGSHHQPDKGVAVVDERRVDDSFLDSGYHVPAGDQRTRGLENGCQQYGAGQRQGAGTHCWSHVIGYIVGADIHRHVTADHCSHHQHESAVDGIKLETGIE